MIITWTNAAQKAAGMGLLSQRVATHHLGEWGDDVAEKGEKTFQDVVKAGGMNTTKKGGPRVKSGEMLNSIGKLTRSMGGNMVARAGFGVGKGSTPHYTKYQEGGTYGNRMFPDSATTAVGSGIPPMMAVAMAKMEMATETTNSGMKMLGKIKGEWDVI